MTPKVTSYLKTHRKAAGLTQIELAKLVGYPATTAVSRHERNKNLPPLVVALAYEALFRVPVTNIFPGLHDAVQQVVEDRLVALEEKFKNSPTRKAEMARIAQVLTWIEGRRKEYPVRES